MVSFTQIICFIHYIQKRVFPISINIYLVFYTTLCYIQRIEMLNPQAAIVIEPKLFKKCIEHLSFLFNFHYIIY